MSKENFRTSLCYGHELAKLDMYNDADMASERDTKKIASSFMATFVGGYIIWQSIL